MGPAVSGFAEVGPALHGLRNVWSTMSAAGAGRPAKRARLEADKRRDALAEVEDKYADIDFTRFQKVVDIDTDADGEATPLRFVLVRPVETALVKDWRQWSSYEPGGAGETLSEEGLAHLPQPGGGQAVLLEQRNCFYNLTMAMLEQVARGAARQ